MFQHCQANIIGCFFLSSQGARGLPGERGRPGAPGPAVSTAIQI